MVYKEHIAGPRLYLTEQVTRFSTIASRILRSSNLSLWPSRLESRHAQNCFACRRSLKIKMPSEIKSSRIFGSFQRELKVILAEKDDEN